LLVQLNADSDIAQLNSLQASADLSAVVLKRDQQQLAAQAVAQAVIDNDMADLKSKRALVAQQAALVAKKTIRAPFAGRLGITTVNPGQYLNPGDKIVTLQTIDPIYVDFSLPQSQIAQISNGQIVNVATDGYPGELFPGKITAINPKVDTTTRNLLVEATIANPQQRLLPGMFARTAIDIGAKKRYLTLPQTAITYNPYGSTVFLLVPPGTKVPAGGTAASGAASATPAAPVAAAPPASAASGGGQVAILSGITEGQEVVTSGQLKLKNGTPVVVDNSVLPANSPNPKPQEK
jgi:membrane fusion protein (multidrug efflux system)